MHRKTNFLVNLYWDNKYSDSDSDSDSDMIVSDCAAGGAGRDGDRHVHPGVEG